MTASTGWDTGPANKINRPKMRQAQPLGEILNGFMGTVISARRKQSEQLLDIWNRMMPPELYGHCRITGFSAGVLNVEADGPGHRYELRLCKRQLLKEINRALTGVRIKEIRISV